MFFIHNKGIYIVKFSQTLHMQSKKSTQNNSIEGARNWKLIQNFGRHFPNATKNIYPHIITQIKILFIINKNKWNTQ